MRILKQLLDFYIQSSIHVALSVYSLVQISYFMFPVSEDKPMAYFAFFGTILGYNFVKYETLLRIRTTKMRFRLKAIAILSLFSFLAVVFYFFQLQRTTQIVAVLFLIITLLYTLPFFPNRKNARNWAGVKIYIVAICWLGVTLVLPILDAGIPITNHFYFKGIQRFILVFVLILIFEIIDLKQDDPHLQTVPQQIGVRRTKFLGYLLLLVFCGLEIFNGNSNSNFQFFPLTVEIGIAIVIALFLAFANEKRSKYYTSFWVESLPIFWWLLLLFA